MRERIIVSVKVVNGERWGDLAVIGHAHEICGETVKLKNENFSFADGHRVRLYTFKKNVHWKIPAGATLDITDVAPGTAPRRQQQR